MMDRGNLYYVEIAAEGKPPGFNKQSWKGLDEASSYFRDMEISIFMRKDVNSEGVELRLWSYDRRREQITLIQVEKGDS